MDDVSSISLEKAILKSMVLANTQSGRRAYATQVLNEFSWDSYGKRYDNFLRQLKR